MEYQRPPGFRFLNGGVDLRDSQDTIPPNQYACVLNARWYQKQGLRARPGYTPLFTTGAAPITDIRAYASLGTDDLPRWMARDTNNVIYLDNSEALVTLAGGAGGVSMIPFRPAASPQAWMYVASSGDYQKIAAPPVALVQKVGIQEPQLQVEAAPSTFVYTAFTALAASWAAGGTAASLANASRSSDTVAAVFSDPANISRKICQVSTNVQYQVGEVTSMGVVQDVLPPIAGGLVIKAIRYASGTSGPCTIVPSQLPLGTEIPGAASVAGYLRRGSLVQLGGSEVDLVLSVVDGQNGLVSFDVVTTATFAAGQAIAGIPAVIIDSGGTGAITAAKINATVSAGVGTLTQVLASSPFATQLGTSGLFPQEDDYVHISVLISNPAQILELKLLFNIDATDTSFQQNAYYYSVSPSVLSAVVTGASTQQQALEAGSAQSAYISNIQGSISQLEQQLQATANEGAPAQNALKAQIAQQQQLLTNAGVNVSQPGSTVPGSSQWTEILFPVSGLTRIGNDQTRTLVNTNRVQLYVNVVSVTAKWSGGTYYPLGYQVVDPAGHIQQVTAAGVSGTTQPVWNDAGGVTSDGSVTWTDLGLNATSVNVSISSLWIGGGGQPDVGDAGADYSYQCVPRASATGVIGNPTPDMRYGVRPRRQPVIVRTGALAQPDPQMDTWDIYRYGGSVTASRFIGSVPFGSDWIDTYFDDAVAAAALLEDDNTEPWPSVDLPYTQTGNITAYGQWLVVVGALPATVTRWLPGTLITIGGAQTFTLRSRPTLVTGTTYLFELEEACGFGAQISMLVQEPILARQTVAGVWGPDAVGTFFGVGDPLRPGVVSWSKPYAPDSVPAANNRELCPPPEPLLGGAIRAGVSLVASSSRWWALYPDFQNPGNYNPVDAPVGRGLVSPFAHVCDGAAVYFWTRDGIASTDGGPFKSLVDENLYPLFSHDAVAGKNVTRNGVTFYAPDYSRASSFRLALSNNYLYALYQDTTGNWRVLSLDLTSGAWVQDQYANPITALWGLHGQPGTLGTETPAVYTRMVLGSASGAVYQSQDYTGDNTTAIPVVIGTFEWDGGDQRAQAQFGDLYLESTPYVQITVQPVSLGTPFGPIGTIAASGVRSFTTVSVGGSVLSKYCGLQLNWTESFPGGSATMLHLWQPSILPQPETTTDRVGDWTDCGTPSNKFFQGVLIKADTFGINKNVQIQDSDLLALHTLLPAAVNQTGEDVSAYAFATPFIAHLVRDVPQDKVPWRRWQLDYVWQPTPEAALIWKTQATAHGLTGYQSIYRIEAAYASTSAVDLSIGVQDGTAPALIVLPSTNGNYQKLLLTPTFNKFQLASYLAQSTSPFFLFLEDWVIWLLPWGRTGPAIPFRNLGGSFGDKATI